MRTEFSSKLKILSVFSLSQFSVKIISY